MPLSATVTNVIQVLIASELSSDKLTSLLMEGDLQGFESNLLLLTNKLYDRIAGLYIQNISISAEFVNKIRSYGARNGLSKLSSRWAILQIGTGSYVPYKSWYAEKVEPKGKTTVIKGIERHVSLSYWSCIKGASPAYYSKIGMLSVICPSFDIAKEVLHFQGTHSNTERCRQLSTALGELSLTNRVENALQSDETLAGERVLIAIDGGRSRIREYNGNDKSNACFDTPLIEPKMFVISTLTKEGQVNKKRLPIYDCTFGDDETFALLEKYLKRLEIDKATDVQFVADGAPWIWNRAKPMLLRLGVPENLITETLDYYHAAEHLTDLIQYMPSDKQKEVEKQLKKQLWAGDIKQMHQTIKGVLTDLDEIELKPFNYFKNNEKRINYSQYKAQKSLVGSGIVESGIRRIINLRFKCPSSFWKRGTLEPLIFLRSILLAGRWNNLIHNLTKIT
jgi:hypothetical protein